MSEQRRPGAVAGGMIFFVGAFISFIVFTEYTDLALGLIILPVLGIIGGYFLKEAKTAEQTEDSRIVRALYGFSGFFLAALTCMTFWIAQFHLSYVERHMKTDEFTAGEAIALCFFSALMFLFGFGTMIMGNRQVQ